MKKTLKVLVCGGRDFNNEILLSNIIDAIVPWNCLLHYDIEFVTGGAEGADKLGKKYADNHCYSCKVFPADWDKNGKSAGFIRNAEMANYIEHDGIVIAFWNYKSKGTEHMIRIARQKKIPVNIIYYDNGD